MADFPVEQLSPLPGSKGVHSSIQMPVPTTWWEGSCVIYSCSSVSRHSTETMTATRSICPRSLDSMSQSTGTLKWEVTRLVCYNVSNLFWHSLGIKKNSKKITMCNSVVAARRSMKNHNYKEQYLMGRWVILAFKIFFLNKEQLTSFHCATWMHFVLHCVTGQLVPEAKPEIPFPTEILTAQTHSNRCEYW